MHTMLLILTCGAGFYIFIEDIRFRAVTWVLFPVLGITGFLYSINLNGSVGTVSVNVGVNYLIVLLEFFGILIYANFRGRDISQVIGTGDILFILAAATFFSPLNFIAYYILSLLLSLFLHLLFVHASLYPGEKRTIPLAGFQAMVLAFVLVAAKICPGINIADDSWMLYKLQLL